MRMRRFVPGRDITLPQILPLDGDADYVVDPSIAVVDPAFIQDATTAVEDALSAENNFPNGQIGYPNGANVWGNEEIPIFIVISTDESGYAAGVAGSSWTGQTNPTGPTQIPSIDAFD